MIYQRSFDIERRLQAVLRLVETGRYSTPQIAEELGISIPTVSRDVTALRERGHEINSRRLDNGMWCYRIAAKPAKRRAARTNNHSRKRA